jgi:4-hydroxybutyrate CoA-transferase
VDALVGRASALRDVTIMQALTPGEPTYATPAVSRSFRVTSFFLHGDLRAPVMHEGRADFVPIFLSEVPGLFRERYPLDWVLVQLSPPGPPRHLHHGRVGRRGAVARHLLRS